MLQLIATCWPLFCLNKKGKTVWLPVREMSAERDCNACWEGSLHLVRGKTWRLIQDKFYKSKTSSRCPNFDTSSAWQMGHNSPEGIFLGQELFLDFAAWIYLTLNTNNTITVYQLLSKFHNTIWFFKTCWLLMGLSRLYDGSQPPGRYTTYFQTMLKILVDRALMWHIFFFCSMVFCLTLDRFTCCVHITITDVNNLFPDFRSIWCGIWFWLHTL